MLNITQTNKEAAFLKVMKIDKSGESSVTLLGLSRVLYTFGSVALYSVFAFYPTTTFICGRFWLTTL